MWRVSAEERREIFLLGCGGRTRNLKCLDFKGLNCCGRDVNQAQKSDFLPFHGERAGKLLAGRTLKFPTAEADLGLIDPDLFRFLGGSE